MQPTRTLRLLLITSGLIAVVIGASTLLAPVQFHAAYGTEIGNDTNLLSEVRAPGAALLTLGLLILTGAFVRSFTFVSTTVAAAVYLAYGVARVLSIALDGVPDSGLIAAAVVELVIGKLCLREWIRFKKRGIPAELSDAFPTNPGEVA